MRLRTTGKKCAFMAGDRDPMRRRPRTRTTTAACCARLRSSISSPSPGSRSRLAIVGAAAHSEGDAHAPRRIAGSAGLRDAPAGFARHGPRHHARPARRATGALDARQQQLHARVPVAVARSSRRSAKPATSPRSTATWCSTSSASKRPSRCAMHMQPGMRVLLHCTASGKLFLSQMSARRAQRGAAAPAAHAHDLSHADGREPARSGTGPARHARRGHRQRGVRAGDGGRRRAGARRAGQACARVARRACADGALATSRICSRPCRS